MIGRINLSSLTAGLMIASTIGTFGCASPEARYYTLSPAPEARGPALAQQPSQLGGPIWIEVVPVRLPERINRVNLVVSNVSGRVRVLEQDRWSAPLADEFRDALSQRLQVGLGAVDTYQRGKSDAEPLYRVSADVIQIDAEMDERVSATIAWTVRRLPDGRTTAGRTQAELVAPGGVDSVVAAYQQVVISTAYDIAAAIRAQRL